jgi:hypothetical protein
MNVRITIGVFEGKANFPVALFPVAGSSALTSSLIAASAYFLC